MVKPAIRITILASLLANLVVPHAAASETARRAFAERTVPRTLARRHEFPPGAERASLRLAIPTTHAMLSWSGNAASGLRYRYARDGRLTAWRRVSESDDMAHGNRHYSSPLLLDRSRTLAWDAVGDAGRVKLDYVNTLDGPSRTTAIAAESGTSSAEPDIVTRNEWGANESWKRTGGGCTRSFYDAQQIFVHHTVTSNRDPDPASTVRAVYHFHTRSRGWCDIGYNFLVSRDGRIFEGRWARAYAPWEVHDGEDRSGRIVAGAHTSGLNSGSIGVSVLGNYQTSRLPRAARSALVRFLAWETDRHDLDPRGRHVYKNPVDGTKRTLRYIAGHRDGGQTSCPGRYLYEALPGIRRSVDRLVGSGKSDSVMTAAKTKPVSYGSPATVEFVLTSRRGEPLSDKTVVVYKKGGGAWSRVGEAATDALGRAQISFTARRNVRVAGVWSGSAHRWGDDAYGEQRVRPLVTLDPEGGIETGPGTYEYPQGTTEIPVSGAVTPMHAGHRVQVLVWQLQPDGSYLRLPDQTRSLDAASTYRTRLTIPPEGGTYKVRTELAGHSDHAFARSRTVQVTVPPPLPVP